MDLGDEGGRTSLSRAAECGRENTLQMRLDHGADSESLDNGGRTLYSWALNPGEDRAWLDERERGRVKEILLRRRTLIPLSRFARCHT